ncbi:cytochrome P450 [Mycolicibacterium sp. 624]|uniref:cytochrome P450 n=1 Tax=Mycolicibacterium sp. 624 TaxID=3156314 RepID=UPI0033961918
MSASSLPPGPPLPRLVQAGLMLRFWPRFVAGCRRRYGRVFTLRIAGIGTLVYVDDPTDLKTVFAGDPSIFHAGEANSMLAGLLGSSSVLVVDDDVHRERRKLVMAPFHRDAVARQAGVMAELAAENIASWPIGTEFAVAPHMSRLTLEVILRTVIGASDPVRLTELRAVMPKLLTLSAWQTLAVANPKLQRRRPWRAVRGHIAEADRLLYAEIADRRADRHLGERSDALAVMIRSGVMTDRELRDQLMTLLVAGHDTTATALSWTLERLTRHPDVLAKAVRAAHASAAGDPAGDEYLDAVGKEVLRIRPVVFDVGRVLQAPTVVAGYRLPAGVMVAPGIGLVHANAELYPDPERFDPDRMVGATLGPTTWLPFGGGNRRCLGATFALTEMRIVLREVLRRVEFATTTAAVGERQRVKAVILVPHRGARVTVRAIHEVGSAQAVDPSSVSGRDQLDHPHGIAH